MPSIPPELLEQQGIHPAAPPAPEEACVPYEQPHHDWAAPEADESDERRAGEPPTPRP